jgi:putative ABC transport system permease protein
MNKKRIKSPPKLAEWLLKAIANKNNNSAIIGDLEEEYYQKVKSRGITFAWLWYWFLILISLPSFFTQTIYWSGAMFKNYIKIAFRNIRRYKVFSSINILGLTLGLTCCIFIMLWIFDELSYDRFHVDSESLFRVEEKIHYSGKTFNSMATSPAVAPALKEQFPGIIDAVRYDPVKNILLKYNDKMFYEPDIVTAEPSFFKLFSFRFIRGDTNSVFDGPNSVVITQDIAEKYFGNEDPIDKVLIFDNNDQYVVKAVIAKITHNTHFKFNIVIPFNYITRRPGYDENKWQSSYISTYVKLDASADVNLVQDKMSQLLKEHRKDSETELYLQPLIDIHLHSRYGSGDILYIYIFSTTALFILIIACINFMNLSTIHSAKRAKEIGMRKVVGAHRKHIISQFFGESLLMTFFAFIIALIIVTILLPQFNQLSGKQVSLNTFANFGNLLIGLVFIIFFTGILAGGYPALLLSSFRPIRTIRGSVSIGSRSKNFRRIMVLVQFSISIFLIIATVIIKSQLSYLQNMNLGWDKEHLIYLNSNDKILPKYNALKNKLISDSRILGVTLSRQLPGRFGNTTGTLRWEGKDPEFSLSAHFNSVDYDFPKTLGIEMSSGRPYLLDFPSDTANAIIINREFEKAMGKEPAVGKPLWIDDRQFNIIGVTENFHLQSARNKIEPAMLFLDPRGTRYIFLRIKPENIASTMSFITETWKTVLPDFPMEYSFMDETYNNLYRAAERMGVLFSYFTTLAIIIACLGLFGLGSFISQQRTKEVGIRKVLGASVSGLFVLLSKDLTKWVLLANLFSWPIAWYVLNRWLHSFAYRTEIKWWIFFLAGTLALIIALMTVSYQTIKAARANPVNSLKYE